MAWWEWLLISIGGWLLIGFACSILFTYTSGRARGSVPDTSDCVSAALLWPAYLVVDFGVDAVILLYRWTYRRGESARDRKLLRQEKRDTRGQLIELFTAEGWDLRKIPKKL